MLPLRTPRHSRRPGKGATTMRIATAFFLAALTVAMPPSFAQDGLELKTQTKQRIVYVKPGASLTQYTRFALTDCYIEFSKDWQDEYNRSVREPSRKITDADLERVKKDLSAQFRKIFVDELSKGGYAMSETTGADVLILRPALINIAVTAPDIRTPGRTYAYASSAGQMTLYLELWDSATNTILGRVADAKANDEIYGQRMTSVDNRAAADQLIRMWAVELRKKMDASQGKAED
jgi:hypothetical protein